MEIPKVIGEGSYGCVHRPPLHCRGTKKKNRTNRVSKLMKRKEIKDEFAEYKLIDKVDPSAEFYLGKPEKCFVDEGDINKAALKKCKNLLINDAHLEINLSKYALLLMEDGGQNLQEFADSFDGVESTPQNVGILEEFWIEAHRILMGLNIFLENGIIHHDMKHQNIVYNPTTKRINIIDFGLMTTKDKIISKIKMSNYDFAIHHWSYPFEYKYINKNTYNRFAQKSLDEKTTWLVDLINSIKSNPDANFSDVFTTFYSTIEMHRTNKWPIQNGNLYNSSYLLEHFCKTILNQLLPTKENYETFYNKSIDTIDSYGVGMGFLYVLKKSSHLLDKPFVMDMVQLFMSMVDPDLTARSTIENTIARYENILESNGLLKKHNKQFIQHKLMDNREHISGIQRRIENADDNNILLNPAELKSRQVEVDETIVKVKQCALDKELNPKTNRCVKTCKQGYSRDTDFNCKRDKKQKSQKSLVKVKQCSLDKEINPKTNRCVKTCKQGYSRDTDFNCKRDKK